MGFSRQEWVAFPSPGDLPHLGTEPALQGGSLPLKHQGSPLLILAFLLLGLPGGTSGNETTCQYRRCKFPFIK